jgi:hypothetical protein
MTENRYSLETFVNKTLDRDLQQGLFELEFDRMLDINLNGEAAIPNSISGFVNWRCRAVAAAIFTWSDQ